MIKHLIFDLDDTVYPSSSKMGSGIASRIKEYSRRFYGLSQAEIEIERPKALKKYISTLEWLHAGGFNDDEDYFSFVHPAGEVSELEPDPDLRGLLESIPLPKVILTNSPSEHAEHVLGFFGIRNLFHETISDIRRNDLRGKPFEPAYRDALNLLGAEMDETLFLDDYLPYVEGYAAIGGKAVWVGSKPGEPAKNLPGKIYRIDNIYQLPELLKDLNEYS